MLTIGQLAAYAGVTVRTVRHYHAKGLLPEPDRDHAGYRRYDAAAVVQLVRIRTLADAGVPLARVSELLDADEAEFAAAVDEVDQRLRAEIRERQVNRARIARLASGDSLALPPEVVAYFERMRSYGFPERLVEMERDSWILVAARMPEAAASLIAVKQLHLESEQLRALYLDIGCLVDVAPDDPRLPELADRVALFIEGAAAATVGVEGVDPITPELVELLDTAFVESFPAARDVLRLLEQRGWTGWTNIRRTDGWTPADDGVGSATA